MGELHLDRVVEQMSTQAPFQFLMISSHMYTCDILSQYTL